MRNNLKLTDDAIYVPNTQLSHRIRNRIIHSISLFIVAGLLIITTSILVSIILLMAEGVHRDDIVVWTIFLVLLGFKSILITSVVILDRNALVEATLLDDRLYIIYKRFNKTKVKEIAYSDLHIQFRTSFSKKLGRLKMKDKNRGFRFYSGGSVTYSQLKNVAEYLSLELVKREKIKPEQVSIK